VLNQLKADPELSRIPVPGTTLGLIQDDGGQRVEVTVYYFTIFPNPTPWPRPPSTTSDVSMRQASRAVPLLNRLWRMNQMIRDFESDNVMQLLFEPARELRREQISLKISHVFRSHIVLDFFNVMEIDTRLHVITA